MKKIEQQNPQDAKLAATNKAATIPAQYQNMSSEEFEEHWKPKTYINDPEKTKAEGQRREQVLEQIRQKDTQREKDKEIHFAQIYSNLPPEKQKDFANFQAEAANEIGGHVKGTAQTPNLSKEEAFILDKMQESYEQAKMKNPNQPIQIQLSRPIDQAVYNNLVRRLSWEKIKDTIKQEDTNKILNLQNTLINTQSPKAPTTAEQINNMFKGIAGGFKESAMKKIEEYDQRIRAVRAGQPLKWGDTEAALLKDFKQLARLNWSDSFTMDKLGGKKEIEPINITALKENPGINERKIDNNKVTFKQEGNEIKVKYDNRDWYPQKGKYTERKINDKVVKVIVSEDPNSPHAAYEPTLDAYIIGPGAKKEFLKDPELYLITVNHEAAHDEYLNLNEKQQRELNNLLLKDPGLEKIFKKFVTALYNDKFEISKGKTAGEFYREAHDVNNKNTREYNLAKEGQGGLKDLRTISFELDGKQNEVFLGLAATEFISYMSSLELGENFFNKAAENGKNLRGGEDPRYDIMKEAFNYIKNKSQISGEMAKFNLFKNNNNEFNKFFGDILKTPPV